MEERRLFFLDIDGTIMDLFFPPLPKDNEEREEVVKQSISTAKIKIFNASLYEYFVKFIFSEVRNSDEIFFVTGRKKHDFEFLTYYNLIPLVSIIDSLYDRICFYPENGTFDDKYYLKWKHDTIISLINRFCRHDNLHSYIFDDNDGYFSMFKNKEFLYFFKIRGNNSWKKLFNNKNIK